MDHAARGAAALSASKYDEAVQHYTAALSANPLAVDYYTKRSTAYQRLQKYPEALSDAEIAVALAHKRAKRELIKEAQLRRGIALFFNEQYGNAEFVLDIVKRLDAKEKTLAIWGVKVQKALEKLDEEDEKRKVTAKEVPDVDLPSVEASAKPAKSVDKKQETPATAAAPAAPKPAVPTPADKIKHDWYQNNENVTFTLLAKGVPKDQATVEIEKDSLSISFPIADSSSDFNYTLDPLYAEIDPVQSTYQVKSTKIEVTLKKATPGVKWHALEGERRTESPAENKTAIPSHVLTGKTNETAPSYPTSSKKGAKNWDKVAKEDLDEADDYEGDETSRFFKQLYKGASPEAQRAMMKSYQESGGTVLSTDWNQVGSKYVAPEPPEGMEAKKYGE